MKVFVRADASNAIGSGHVMRCLVLADALAARGARIHFVCRAHPGHYGHVIQERGHDVTLLPAETNAPVATPLRCLPSLGADQVDDATRTRAVLEAEGGADLLVVDHYGLGQIFECALRPAVTRILVIDDLADRPHDCDLLLDHNLGAETEHRYASLVPERTRLLLGTRYALIPPAFAAARRARDGSIRQILVFFGGVDATNASLDVLRGLEAAAVAERSITVDVLVGGMNPHRATLETFAAGRTWVRLLAPLLSLAPLLGRYDLAIGAGGVSAIERAAAALPTLLLAVAGNQIGPARSLALAGGAIGLGVHDAASAAAVTDAVRLLLQTPELVRHVSECAARVCDGRGLARVVAQLVSGAIELRHAEPDDAERLWRWRNHPSTRLHSHDSAEIPLDRHLAWFEATLRRGECDLLIGRDDAGDVGVLRYDRHRESAVVSIYLDPARRGAGLGFELLAAGTRWINTHRSGVRRITAHVLTTNRASRRAFIDAGYEEHESIFVFDLEHEKYTALAARYQ